MDAATKASILHGMIRRMGAGGADITADKLTVAVSTSVSISTQLFPDPLP